MRTKYVRYKKLIGKIYENFDSKADFLKAVDMTDTALYNKLNDKTEFTADEMKRISLACEIPQQDVGVYFF